MNQSPLSVFQTGITGQPDLSVGSIMAEWESPSNIALVKYWGKKEGQLPANPSLSMTLSKALTRTTVIALKSVDSKYPLTVNGEQDHPFASKLQKLVHWLVSEIPLLERYSLQVTTTNSFPHSTGIASSASGISAFALCMLTIISKITGKEIPDEEFLRIASFISRMGSGSACRSVYGGFSLWGSTAGIPDSSDLYAVPLNDKIHPDLQNLRDAILVVSSSPKSLASSLGHKMMDLHPFSKVRTQQALNNLLEAFGALEAGDFDKLGLISENEALTLHSLIMTSEGGTILMEPGSLEILKRVRMIRQRGLPVFFSLDAGPNVHILYPDNCSESVEKFIREELATFCENDRVIFDRCGDGPQINN